MISRASWCNPWHLILTANNPKTCIINADSNILKSLLHSFSSSRSCQVLALIKESHSLKTFFFPNECVGSAVLINKASKVKLLWLRSLGRGPETSVRESLGWRMEGGIISEPDLIPHRDSCRQLMERYLSGIVSPGEPICCLRYPENLILPRFFPRKNLGPSKLMINYAAPTLYHNMSCEITEEWIMVAMMSWCSGHSWKLRLQQRPLRRV